jgi:hypothetical protein
MDDIFFSYKHEDRATVELVVGVLQNSGFSVWWDRDLIPGDTYRRTIKQALDQAKCVIVAWSETSADSIWVHDEATRGIARGILVPITLDGVRPPLGFGEIQTLDLTGWSGNQDDPRIRQLVVGVERYVKSSTQPPQTSPIQTPAADFSDSISQFFRGFFNKERGRSTPLKEFPSLFAMEGHTGLFGVGVAGIWFVSAFLSVPTLLTNAWFVTVALAIVILFLFLASLSFVVSNHYQAELNILNNLIPKEALPKEKALDYNVRAWIAILSSAYIALCCILFWLTGGAYSPLTPFYVMIFTLTITRNKVPYPGFYVLGGFLLVFGIAAWAAVYFPSPIQKADLSALQQGLRPYIAASAVICLSLIVPTISAFFVERRKEREDEDEKRRIKALLDAKGSADVNNTEDVSSKPPDGGEV